MKLDASYWTLRYENGTAAWDLGAVSPPLKNFFDALPDKRLRILIPGAGNAYEAEYLVHAGFSNVHVCDLSRVPLDNLRQRCPSLRADQVIQANFFDLSGRYDLMIEQTFFCAIDPRERQEYFSKAQQLLQPSGILAGLLFDDKLNDDQPPFGGSKAEYEALAEAHFIVRTLETAPDSVKPRLGRELFMVMQARTL